MALGSGEDEPTLAEPVGSTQQIREIISRQLDAKLQPLIKEMATCRDEGSTISDILGGIGYILGLVGMGAYIRYRKDVRRT